MIERILLDMDGVTTNFVQGVADDFGVDVEILDCWGLWTPLEISETEFWKWLNGKSAKWWADLEPYPWAQELYELCRSIAPVTFATSPSKSPASYAGKRRWLDRHFGKVDAMFGHQKELMSKSGVVLIDDADKNVNSFQYPGMTVLFPQPWNLNAMFAEMAFAQVCYDLGRLSASDSTESCVKDCCDQEAEPARVKAFARGMDVDYDCCGRQTIHMEVELFDGLNLSRN